MRPFNSRTFSLWTENTVLCESGNSHLEHWISATVRGKEDSNPPSYMSLVEKKSSDSVSASSLSTSRRSERRVMATSRAHSEPVLQSSIPAGGRISAFTSYKVWAGKGEKRTEEMYHTEDESESTGSAADEGLPTDWEVNGGDVCPGAVPVASRAAVRFLCMMQRLGTVLLQ